MNQSIKRDYTLLVDASGSMDIRDAYKGLSRWEEAREAVGTFAVKCAELDPDGLDLYFFADGYKQHKNLTNVSKVSRLFNRRSPGGTTNLVDPLDAAIENYFRKRAKAAKRMEFYAETILIIGDGRPNSVHGVEDVIVQATKRLDNGEELALNFIQVGQDSGATRFLKSLDDDLESRGAKFDIVDTKTAAEIELIGVEKALLDAIVD